MDIKLIPCYNDECMGVKYHNGEFIVTFSGTVDRIVGCYSCGNQETTLYVGDDNITVPRINPDAAIKFALDANLI